MLTMQRRILKTKGITFVDSDTASFQEAVKPVYEKFKKENPESCRYAE